MSTLRTALIAGAAMLAAVGTASADTYSVSRTFGPATTDFSIGPLTVAGFDTTRGTLTGVTVSLSSQATVGGTLTNTASGTQTFTLREETDVTTSSSVASLSGLTNALISSQGYTLASGASAAYGPYSPTATASATPTSLAAFQGGTLSFSVATQTGTTVLGGGGNVNTSIVTTAAGTLAVTYTYTATATPPVVGVPEPASMALLGAGLVGLGLVRRRK